MTPTANNSLNIFFLICLCLVLLSAGSVKADYLYKNNNKFKYTLSSGVFSIHKKAHSVDWALMNKSNRAQEYRVTIYEVSDDNRQFISPGSITGMLEPKAKTHNANSVGKNKPFQKGRKYEIVVEVNSRKVNIKAEMWSGAHGSTVIKSTIIKHRQFRKIK